MSGEAKLPCFIAAYVAIGWATSFVYGFCSQFPSSEGVLMWAFWPFVWVVMLIVGASLGIGYLTAFCSIEVEVWVKKHKSKTSLRILCGMGRGICNVVRFVFMPWKAGKALSDKI